MVRAELVRAVMVTGEIYGREFSEAAAEVFCSDLADFPGDAVLRALSLCRRELRTFPTIADILARIDDGRPGAEEAWALIPKDESASVVWCDEMAEAFGAVRGLMDDPVAARLAFREVYLRLLAESRRERKPVRWSPSLGHDPHGRVPVIAEAVAKGRLTHNQGQALLPSPEAPQGQMLLSGGESEPAFTNAAELAAQIRKRLLGDAAP